MSNHQKNFQVWYVETLAFLYQREEAGFPILMITFPLLERYVNRKQVALGCSRDRVLLNLFPNLSNEDTVKLFWKVTRDSLLHNVSLALPERGKVKALAWITHDKPMITYENSEFYINAVDFSKYVLEIIQGDFATFEGDATERPLPEVETAQEIRRSGPTQIGSDWKS